MDSEVAALVARAVNSLGAGGFSFHLLLLSRRVLQSVLGRPARVCRRRATSRLSRRAKVSAYSAKCSSLFSLPRADFYRLSRSRCLECVLVHRRGDGRNFLRHRSGHDNSGGEYLFSRRLYIQLSFFAAPGRR